MICGPRSLMELERKRGTSHHWSEWARFSKLVARHPTRFFQLFTQHQLSAFFIFTCAFSSLSLFCIHSPSPSALLLFLCFRGLAMWPNFKEFSCFWRYVALKDKRACSWRHLLKKRKLLPLVPGRRAGLGNRSYTGSWCAYLHCPAGMESSSPILVFRLKFHHLTFINETSSLYAFSKLGTLLFF